MSAELVVSKSNHAQQVLTFRLGEKYFAVDILAVKEIHGWTETRDIPDTPDWIVGVLDWRGTIVPIVDLRLRFGEREVEYTKTTVVVILQTAIVTEENDESMPVTLGIVVDAVSDVVEVHPEDLRSSPGFGKRVDTRFIQGMFSQQDNMVILLDVSRLVNLDELSGDDEA